MKGILLAGGKGTRLHPLTRITNKHLIAVYDKPMIMYPLELLTKSGIKDILIISGREHAGHFLEFLGSGADLGINLTYRVQDQAGGIAHALLLAENFAKDDDMTVILCDNIFEQDFKKYVGNFKSGARIFLKSVPDAQRFGVAVVKNGIVEKIIEKPKNPPSQLAVTGIYQYDHRVFDIIKKLKPSARGEYEITDVNNAYIKTRELQAEIIKGYWSDVGTHASLARTIKWVANKK